MQCRGSAMRHRIRAIPVIACNYCICVMAALSQRR
ncbi:hypothetical protein CBM2626_B10199 [Cupriavidus taiwanensis]|nr:hypothetical protein CBM2626_B10199 [Cupriavidus taiwanensis]